MDLMNPYKRTEPIMLKQIEEVKEVVEKVKKVKKGKKEAAVEEEDNQEQIEEIQEYFDQNKNLIFENEELIEGETVNIEDIIK